VTRAAAGAHPGCRRERPRTAYGGVNDLLERWAAGGSAPAGSGGSEVVPARRSCLRVRAPRVASPMRFRSATGARGSSRRTSRRFPRARLVRSRTATTPWAGKARARRPSSPSTSTIESAPHRRARAARRWSSTARPTVRSLPGARGSPRAHPGMVGCGREARPQTFLGPVLLVERRGAPRVRLERRGVREGVPRSASSPSSRSTAGSRGLPACRAAGARTSHGAHEGGHRTARARRPNLLVETVGGYGPGRRSTGPDGDPPEQRSSGAPWGRYHGMGPTTPPYDRREPGAVGKAAPAASRSASN